MSIREVMLYKNRHGAWKARIQGRVDSKESTAETLAYGSENEYEARAQVLREANAIITCWHNREDSDEWLRKLIEMYPRARLGASALAAMLTSRRFDDLSVQAAMRVAVVANDALATLIVQGIRDKDESQREALLPGTFDA